MHDGMLRRITAPVHSRVLLTIFSHFASPDILLQQPARKRENGSYVSDDKAHVRPHNPVWRAVQA